MPPSIGRFDGFTSAFLTARKKRILWLIAAMLLLAAPSGAQQAPQQTATPSQPAAPQGQAPAQNSAQEQTPITLPPGTQLALILTHPVDSKVMHRGKDRKSARQNASHTVISYAVFCLKKKKSESCPLQGS